MGFPIFTQKLVSPLDTMICHSPLYGNGDIVYLVKWTKWQYIKEQLSGLQCTLNPFSRCCYWCQNNYANISVKWKPYEGLFSWGIHVGGEEPCSRKAFPSVCHFKCSCLDSLPDLLLCTNYMIALPFMQINMFHHLIFVTSLKLKLCYQCKLIHDIWQKFKIFFLWSSNEISMHKRVLIGKQKHGQHE